MDGLPNVAGKGPVVGELERIGGWETLLSRTTISVATNPQEASIEAITERAGCAPLAAQMCFAELLKRVGGLADANGTRQPEEYVGAVGCRHRRDRIRSAARRGRRRDRRRDQCLSGTLPSTC